jgi:glutaminase
VSKPFIYTLVCQALEPKQAREKIGENSIGLPFNSLVAIEQSGDGQTNPTVCQSGAIETTSIVPGATPEAEWQFIHQGLSRFAGRNFVLDDDGGVNRLTIESSRIDQSPFCIGCDGDSGIV